MVLAEICERFGQLDETENFATRAAAIAPGNVSASLPRAKVLRRRKRVEEAEAVLLEENRRLAKRTRWKIFYPHNCRLSGIVIFPKRKKFGRPIGGRLLVDKNSSLLVACGDIAKVFPETKFIVALGDPREVCLSCFMQLLTPAVTNTASMNTPGQTRPLTHLRRCGETHF